MDRDHSGLTENNTLTKPCFIRIPLGYRFPDVERISVSFAEAKCARHASSTMAGLRLSSASI